MGKSALIVGISNYESISPLTYLVQDAKDVSALSISQDYHEIKAEIESGKASLGETRKYRKELSGELIDILQDILNHYFPDQARQAA